MYIRYSRKSGTQSLFGHFGKEKNLLPARNSVPSPIIPKFQGCTIETSTGAKTAGA